MTTMTAVLNIPVPTPAHVGDLPMTVPQTLDALDKGLVVRGTGGFEWTPAARRHCTVCGVTLPKQRVDGSADTFPRCSRDAY